MSCSKDRYSEIFDRIKRLNIAVIGDVMLDRYFWGDVDRISPEAPVPIVTLRKEEMRIGGAANVADNLSVLGARPHLVSIIGDDAEGEEFLRHSKELGLDTSLVIKSNIRPTTVKTRVIARNQQICRIDKEYSNSISAIEFNNIIRIITDILEKVDAIIISDYGKGVITSELVARIVEFCRKKDSLVSVDPKEHHWEYYSRVDLIKPNHHETARATGIPTDTEKGLEEAGWKLLEKTGAKAALITTGERGMSLFKPGDKVEHMKTAAREVFDVTGAGDTVIAVATAALSAGASLMESAIIANNAAGLVVAEVGTAAAKPADILKNILNTEK